MIMPALDPSTISHARGGMDSKIYHCSRDGNPPDRVSRL